MRGLEKAGVPIVVKGEKRRIWWRTHKKKRQKIRSRKKSNVSERNCKEKKGESARYKKRDMRIGRLKFPRIGQ